MRASKHENDATSVLAYFRIFLTRQATIKLRGFMAQSVFLSSISHCKSMTSSCTSSSTAVKILMAVGDENTLILGSMFLKSLNVSQSRYEAQLLLKYNCICCSLGEAREIGEISLFELTFDKAQFQTKTFDICMHLTHKLFSTFLTKSSPPHANKRRQDIRV